VIRGDGRLLAQHHEQVRQARRAGSSRRPAGGGNSGTPADDGEEARDDPLIANPVAFQLFVQVPAEMNDGVPVIPARPLGMPRSRSLRTSRWPPVERGLLQRTPPPSNSPSRTLRASAHLHDLCLR